MEVGASLLVEVHPCASDAVANHVPAGWPGESLAGSDSEELGEKPCLKVETKVSVELHLGQQGNHCSEHLLDGDIGVQSRPGGAPPTQPPEQRKGASESCGPHSPEVSGPESGGRRDGVRERGAMVAEGLLGKEGPAWQGARRGLLSELGVGQRCPWGMGCGDGAGVRAERGDCRHRL